MRGTWVDEQPSFNHLLQIAVIFCMDFPESDLWRGGEYVVEVSVLQPESRTFCSIHRYGLAYSRLVDQAFFSANSFNWPWPVSEVGDAVSTQVPAGTSFQALP